MVFPKGLRTCLVQLLVIVLTTIFYQQTSIRIQANKDDGKLSAYVVLRLGRIVKDRDTVFYDYDAAIPLDTTYQQMTERPKRVRTLTYKAMAQYELDIGGFEEKVNHQWGVVAKLLVDDKTLESLDESKLYTLRSDITKEFNKYDSLVAEYRHFLENSRTEGSLQSLELLATKENSNRKHTQSFLDNLKVVLQRLKKDNGSVRSRVSSIQLTKLNVAKARAAYAEKQVSLERQKIALEEQEMIRAASLHREKANLVLDLKLLEQKKELAVAEAELEFAESEEEQDSVIVPVLDPLVRTNQYVQETTKNLNPLSTAQNLNPLATTFTPGSVSQNTCSSNNDLTKLLLKKDILVSRFSVFTDQPEVYTSWKTTFLCVCKEIGTTPEEEIDLLIKWLGPSSKSQVISLKTAYAYNSVECLRRVWERLDERFGSAESVYYSTVKKLESFPKLSPTDSAKLYNLSDIISEIEGLKMNPRYSSTLSYFDSAVGVNTIVTKLPFFLQERWTTEASRYKTNNCVPYPPFSFFAQFIRQHSRIRNDPSFFYNNPPVSTQSTQSSKSNKVVKTSKTSLSTQNDLEKCSEKDFETQCPIHNAKHNLNVCRAFLAKSHDEKRKLLHELKICFRCLTSTSHISKNCPKNILCQKCSKKHATAMHMENLSKSHGGEQSEDTVAASKCTDICNAVSGTASCSKIVLVDISIQSNPNCKLRTYAILDDQSNRSLAKPKLFSLLDIHAPEKQYTIKSCSGSVVTSGRQVNSCIVESIDGSFSYKIPTLIECADLPCNLQEICTPEQARHFPHLCDVPISDRDQNAEILLLLGRDVIDVHHVFEQVIGPPGTPFAQRIGLGWVIIGELCLDTMHSQTVVNVNKTNILSSGRPSLFKPCESKISVDQSDCFPYDPIFVRKPDDNKVSLSIEDHEFLGVMKTGFELDQNRHWVAPLPFRSPRQKLPNNYAQALKRAKIFDLSLRKNSVKMQHSLDFMNKILANGHAEGAPNLEPNEERWYLPLFGVYHPRKPNQIRIVFDSSAIFEGISLNKVLLPGPDLVSSLVGVLMRFRSDQVAIMADIEQMFYSFSVSVQHRNFLRFLWYENNDPSKQLVEFRMCKHVFGNCSSPAISTYGLRKSVERSDKDVCKFVTQDFYVDDGLTSLPSADKAIDLLQRTRSDLSSHGLRLHKISSNDAEVMKAFPQEDLANNLKDLDFDRGQLPQQRSLGVGWDLNCDSFLFTLDMEGRQCTRRGILSIVNSIFDPLGFLAPVTIEGKCILRNVTATKVGWDDPICQDLQQKWSTWLESLKVLEQFRIPRTYFKGQSLSIMSGTQLHVFSDASEKAMSAVVYVVGFSNHVKYVGFVCGKAKVAPLSGHTIPRLELCAAVLAVELSDTVLEHLGVGITEVLFYSDSKVTLGYICNQSRRFYTYVSNRIQRIRQSSSPDQWKFVSSHLNPADVGSRGISPDQLADSIWFTGPPFLYEQVDELSEDFPLVDPDQDSEVRPCVSSKATAIEAQSSSLGLGTSRFEKFSSWSKLVSALMILHHIALSFCHKVTCNGWHICKKSKLVERKLLIQQFVIKEVQQKLFHDTIQSLERHKPLPKNSSVLRLNPFLDENGIMRVGGRLSRSKLSDLEKHPVLLPGKHHVSRLLVSHYHDLIKHQGRLLTEGAIREAGFWITGCKRLVSSLINNCVRCKKLRGKFQVQTMSDLPIDRVTEATPFTYVGVDVFGPWTVVSRRTRGGQVNSKRWAVMFTCLTIRAVHIEVIEEMSSSAFINALRRFTAVRGKVKQYRSDRGTNFVWATDNLGINAINVEDEISRKYLYNTDSVWIFNAPHSSHMGGAWERMIGITRRILDSMLSEAKTLTHDVLVTFMAEASAIINSRPVVSISYDESDPEILSPSKLLTMKFSDDQQPAADLDIKNLYRSQWQRVKFLADKFWLKWRKDYLHSLQQRRKWTSPQVDLKVDDVVLIKDIEVGRCYWPMGRVQNVFQSEDGKVRKVELCAIKNGKRTTYIRPIVELVKLV